MLAAAYRCVDEETERGKRQGCPHVTQSYVLNMLPWFNGSSGENVARLGSWFSADFPQPYIT